MKQNNNHRLKTDSSDDLRIATLGIHLSETSVDSACPSEEDMARLIDTATITDPQFSDFFKHLAQCEECYHTWLNLTVVQEKSIGEKVLNHLKRPGSLSIMGSALAVAATFLIVLHLPPKDQLRQQINAPLKDNGHIELLQEKQLNEARSTPSEEMDTFSQSAEAETPVPMPESTSDADDQIRVDSKKEKSQTQRQLSAKPRTIDTDITYASVKNEIRRFCSQTYYDENQKEQLTEMTSRLLEHTPHNSELIEINIILSKMTSSTQQQLCGQLESFLKK